MKKVDTSLGEAPSIAESMGFSYGFGSNFMAPLRSELKGFGVDVQMLVELIEDDQFFTEDNGYITDN